VISKLSLAHQVGSGKACHARENVAKEAGKHQFSSKVMRGHEMSFASSAIPSSTFAQKRSVY